MDNEPLDPPYTEVFSVPENGTPNNIKQAGCLALAQLGKEVWNALRSEYPVRFEAPNWENNADFSKVDFCAGSQSPDWEPRRRSSCFARREARTSNTEVPSWRNCESIRFYKNKE
ncbi:MAG: hypothetical protein ACU83U_12670 [Gammaproteobacteria bacterium]